MPAQGFKSQAFLRRLGPVIVLLGVWVLFAILTKGIFLTPRNFSNLMRQAAINGIIAVGMTLVLITGQIDLSVGAMVGLAGMAAVYVQVAWHAGLVLSLLTGIGVGLASGILQGSLTAYGRIPSYVVTLGGLLVWRGIAKALSGGTTYPVAARDFKGMGQAYLTPGEGIVVLILGIALAVWIAVRQNQQRVAKGELAWSPFAFLGKVLVPAVTLAAIVLGLNEYAGVPVPVLIFAIIALIIAFVLQGSSFGQSLYTLGAKTGESAAIENPANIVWAFAILGVLTGLAGMIYAARLGSAGPEAGTLLEIDVIAACVIGGVSLAGGRGAILGACLGAVVTASIDNGMSLRNVPDYAQYIVKGIVLVAAVGISTLSRRRN